LLTSRAWRPPWVDLVELLVVGLVAGIASGLLGVGGGLLIVPAMVLLLGLSQHVAHAASLAAIVPIALAGVLIFGQASQVDPVAGALLSLGAVLGVRIGAQLMRRTAERRLRVSFGLFLIAMALLLVIR
jgi:uncharacterized membrane protein YfcA